MTDMLHLFFHYARERESIRRRRESGQPAPWTDDPVLRSFRFCNVHREDDAVTEWFRDAVRDPLSDCHTVLPATVAMRWFNRIASGQALFKGAGLDLSGEGSRTPWECLLGGDHGSAAMSLRTQLGTGPYVSAAYMIRTPTGLPKLDGVVECIDIFLKTSGWRAVAQSLLDADGVTPIRETWEWLRRQSNLGPFLAYEIVTDLSHTDLHDQAEDLMTWANPGPGAFRGLNRMHGRRLKDRSDREARVVEMRRLLDFAHYDRFWPGSWEPWTMRTVEHTLCEFDKWMRAHSGDGRPKQTYQPVQQGELS